MNERQYFTARFRTAVRRLKRRRRDDPGPDSYTSSPERRLADTLDDIPAVTVCADCGALMVIQGTWATCPADPSHHLHDDDGTVEGCGGCFTEPPGPGQREVRTDELGRIPAPVPRPDCLWPGY